MRTDDETFRSEPDDVPRRCDADERLSARLGLRRLVEAVVGRERRNDDIDWRRHNAAPAGSDSPSSQTQLQQDALQYARCMRANGVPNFPDPNAGGGFLFHTGNGVDPSSPAFQAARAKCQKLLPSGPTPGSTTHPSAQWLAQMVKAAQCMRRHGIADFPDPATTVPSLQGFVGVVSDIEGAIFVFPATLDTQSPAFTRAAAACRFPLHNH